MNNEHEHHTFSSDERHGHHGFADAEAVAKRLEAPERESWQKPEEVIASFQLPNDATVAEIGAGTGYFVLRLARSLSRGSVVGLDTEPRMVEYLRQRIADLALPNAEARLVDLSAAIPLAEPVDLLLCVDTYHHIPDRISYISGFAEHLKRSGKLVIIDRPLEAPEGPPAYHRISAQTVAEEMARAGFTLIESVDLLQPYQYYLAFTRADHDPNDHKDGC
jgi:SAM-dependent methyltransferase